MAFTWFPEKPFPWQQSLPQPGWDLYLRPPLTVLPLPWDTGTEYRKRDQGGSTGVWFSSSLLALVLQPLSRSLCLGVSMPSCISREAPRWPHGSLEHFNSSLFPSPCSNQVSSSPDHVSSEESVILSSETTLPSPCHICSPSSLNPLPASRA